MASNLITSIQSALDDLKLLRKRDKLVYNPRFRYLICALGHLRTFFLCARKLGKGVDQKSNGINNEDASLGSLLERIEDKVSRNAEKIHPCCLSPEGGLPETEMKHFINDISIFEEETGKWYITILDSPRDSCSPMAHEAVEIIDSLLESPVDYLSLYNFTRGDLLEALKGKLAFFRSFIRFATLQGIEHQKLENLLAHIEAASINTSYLLACLSYTHHDLDLDGVWFKISELLQKIKCIDRQVYETYTQALINSKLARKFQASTLGMDDDPLIIIKDFIDSLLCDLWEILKESCPVVYGKDQLQVLYEELRFFRTFLKEQPNKFDEKIKDLAGDLVCDAGVIILSLSQKDVEIDVQLQYFLERINIIWAELEVRNPGITSNFPRTNEVGFVDFVLEYLVEQTSFLGDSSAQNRFHKIHDEVVFLRSFLEKIAELRSEKEELQALWNHIMEVAYRVEFLIDQMRLGAISDSFSMSFHSITEDIRNIKTDASKILDGNKQDIKVKKVTRTSTHLTSQTTGPIITEVVGFGEEAISIIDRLTRGSKQLRIIAVVGMAGLGKTTLVSKVYNNSSVVHHFVVRAWSSVSQVFDKKNVLLELLKHDVSKLPDRYVDMTEQDLAEQLRRCLKQRKYLIFLDDVWDIEVLNGLFGSLPDDSNGSRIILTSRLHDVVPKALLDEEPHFLRQLNKDESWELLQRKLFPGKRWPPALHELGVQIVENSKGLPLTIVLIAGLLTTLEQEGWKKILEGLSSGIISSTKQCMNTLELSYKHLPDYLKPCFLYFGAFPEDRLVPVKKLIQLWIAEGFVRKTESKSLEDVATEYMMDLIGRSLVMVANQKSIGGVKACRVHDLLHDYCLTKAKEENFFHLIRGYDELLAFNEPRNLRRLSIHSMPKHFKDSRLFCPRVRSLLFFAQSHMQRFTLFDIFFILHIFKLLRVLDIGHINLGPVFPSEIELLVHLRYLAVLGEMNVIPSNIGNLSNLETFVVNSRASMVSLPDTLWNLRKLRHLYKLLADSISGFGLPTGNLDKSANLYELDSFSGASMAWENMEILTRKFPNISKLKCKLFMSRDCRQIFVPDFLIRLESLDMSPFGIPPHHFEFEFGFPPNLKKLTLSGFRLPWNKISTIGKLPNLEVLKLLRGSFSGVAWDMEEGEFLKLRFLKLASLDIVRWTAFDDQFPNLQKLVLEKCHNLNEIPSSLESIATLEMIEVWNCAECITTSVKQIQDVQMTWEIRL